MYRKREKENLNERIDFFYKVEGKYKDIKNMEPDKCESIDWFEINKLPNNIIPFINKVIEEISKGNIYSEYGW